MKTKTVASAKHRIFAVVFSAMSVLFSRCDALDSALGGKGGEGGGVW